VQLYVLGGAGAVKAVRGPSRGGLSGEHQGASAGVGRGGGGGKGSGGSVDQDHAFCLLYKMCRDVAGVLLRG
jgi:hypothetical protein